MKCIGFFLNSNAQEMMSLYILSSAHSVFPPVLSAEFEKEQQEKRPPMQFDTDEKRSGAGDWGFLKKVHLY